MNVNGSDSRNISELLIVVVMVVDGGGGSNINKDRGEGGQ